MHSASTGTNGATREVAPRLEPFIRIERPRECTLRDGSRVLIRPIAEIDEEAERAFIAGLSPESRRYRFLGAISEASDALVARLTHVDMLRDVAFAAVVPDGSRQRFVGVARYGTDAMRQWCECAVTVADDWQDKGLGTALMRHLIDVARARDIRRMVSHDAATNVRMRELAHFLGFGTRTDPDDPTQVVHELTL